MSRSLQAIPLTQDDFAEFGQIIDLAQRPPQRTPIMINDGLTERFHKLADIDTADNNGSPIVSIFRTQPIPLPHQVREMERHPLGSQTFIPLDSRQPFYVLCATDQNTDVIQSEDLVLFKTNGQQGVNLAKNTWHHYQLVPGYATDFLVIDRAGPGKNIEIAQVEGKIWLQP